MLPKVRRPRVLRQGLLCQALSQETTVTAVSTTPYCVENLNGQARLDSLLYFVYVVWWAGEFGQAR